MTTREAMMRKSFGDKRLGGDVATFSRYGEEYGGEYGLSVRLIPPLQLIVRAYLGMPMVELRGWFFPSVAKEKLRA